VIGHLNGRLLEKSPAEILVEVGGIGYRLAVPLPTYEKLPAAGGAVSLSVHTHVREDLIALYGFETRRERDLFERLITVPGIGPRLALAIHSHLGPAHLVDAVRQRDITRLTKVPGVGRKTAERLLLELESLLGKLEGAAFGEARADLRGPRSDLHSALENLGYKPAQIAPVLDALLAGKEAGGAPLEDLLREALRRLGASIQTNPPAQAVSAAGGRTGTRRIS